jgi:phosphoglycerate dehydrogenase-like enzyme
VTRRAILIHSPHIALRRAEWEEDYRVFTLDDVADGVPAEVADSVEVIVSGGDPLDNALVDSLPRLALVACFSTGFAGIDLVHLRSRGISLTTAAGINAHDVADHAIALLLALWHGIPTADRLLRDGGWRNGLVPRRSLRGVTAGVVGLGRIGSAIADRLAAHEIKVSWWGPRDKPAAHYPRASSLLELAQRSEILVLATRSTPENARQINSDVLAAIGSTGVIINVSRGMLVDEAALTHALRTGSIGGAALDVFVEEPTDSERWAGLPNLVVTPHIAGYTAEAGVDMNWQLRENVRRHFAGEGLLSPADV